MGKGKLKMKLTDKDQAAIDHVASVSKHPHAAMIVKWLITGWDVKRKGTSTIIEAPYWISETEYELIEPKPVKPAYRVYLDANGKPANVIRFSNGTFSHANTEDTKWISEWIEYDPPKKWPTQLVERIAKIDIKAAEWIVDNWDNLIAGKYLGDQESNKLFIMFNWSLTSQGGEYWSKISEKLGE